MNESPYLTDLLFLVGLVVTPAREGYKLYPSKKKCVMNQAVAMKVAMSAC